MPEPKQIFRETSLERLSSPEQLDFLMQVTTPKGWYALGALCCLLAAAFLWSILGRLPIAISGPALIMPPSGVEDVYAPEAGIVRELLVKDGDLVEAGEIVARLEQKEMVEKGSRNIAELVLKISNTESRIHSLQREVQAKKEALSMGLIPPGELDTSSHNLASARTDLKTLRDQYELGGLDLRRAQDVRANKRGRVVEVLVSLGTLVSRGDPLFTCVSPDEEVQAVAFIPELGDQARPGMKADVAPSTIKKEEFGHLVGEVAQVSDFPARPNLLYGLTHNHALMSQLEAKGDPYIVWIALEKDARTFSGFRWSSRRGPLQKIQAGMMAEARVVVRNQRPITMVVPALKSFLGF